MTSSGQAQPRRVLVGFDGSSSGEAALAAAIDHARLRQVPLHVVSAVEVPGGRRASDDHCSSDDHRSSDYHRAATDAVDGAVCQAVAVLGPDAVTSCVRAGSPASVLLAEARPDDLLVVGSHGHRPVARMLLGSTSTALTASAPCPVLVVRGPRIRSRGPVVVGVDGSAGSRGALLASAEMAEREGVPLRAVLALNPVPDALGFVTGPDAPDLSAAEEVLADAAAVLAAHHPDLAVEQVLAQTHPVEALLRHSRGARLVVVGCRGLGGVQAMLLGSVSQELLHHASCPVLVVRAAALAPGPLLAVTA